MRDLLFLSHRIPYPPDKGEKIRAWHVLEHLSQSYRVHLGCLIDDADDWAHIPVLQAVCADVGAFGIDKRRAKALAALRVRPGRPLMLDYYQHAGLRRWVGATMARTPMDVLYVYTAAMAPYVLPAGRGGLVLDMVDIDSEKWSEYARHAKWPMRALWAREGRTLLAYERSAALACDQAFLVTDEECRRFAELAPETAGHVTPIENGVDLDRFSPLLSFKSPYTSTGPHIVFTGHMDYWPNKDAVGWFVTDVMPRLRPRDPPAQMHIVGANPGLDTLRLAEQPNVHVTGRVADTRPYVAHAAVSVTPLRLARGVQNKVLEAMALGTPVVTGPQSAQCVQATPGRDFLVANGAEPMAAMVDAVLDGKHAGLGMAGRKAMEAHYAWPDTLARLDARLQMLPNMAPRWSELRGAA